MADAMTMSRCRAREPRVCIDCVCPRWKKCRRQEKGRVRSKQDAEWILCPKSYRVAIAASPARKERRASQVTVSASGFYTLPYSVPSLGLCGTSNPPPSRHESRLLRPYRLCSGTARTNERQTIMCPLLLRTPPHPAWCVRVLSRAACSTAMHEEEEALVASALGGRGSLESPGDPVLPLDLPLRLTGVAATRPRRRRRLHCPRTLGPPAIDIDGCHWPGWGQLDWPALSPTACHWRQPLVFVGAASHRSQAARRDRRSAIGTPTWHAPTARERAKETSSARGHIASSGSVHAALHLDCPAYIDAGTAGQTDAGPTYPARAPTKADRSQTDGRRRRSETTLHAAKPEQPASRPRFDCFQSMDMTKWRTQHRTWPSPSTLLLSSLTPAEAPRPVGS